MLFDFIKSIVCKLDTCLYVETSATRLYVKNLTTGAIFDEQPLMAMSASNDIIVIGNQSIKLSTDTTVRLINPFDHPRLPIANFAQAEKVLHYAILQVMNRTILMPSPKIILRPLHNLAGGLADLEIRALRELCHGAGALDSIIYMDNTPIVGPVNFNQLKEKFA